MLASLQIFQTFDLSTVFYRLSMDNVDIIFDAFKQNEIDVDKQTFSFHINTINQHRDTCREMNTRGENLEQVCRDINSNIGTVRPPFLGRRKAVGGAEEGRRSVVE
jgi:hypothetical protein